MVNYKYQSEIENLHKEILLFHEKRRSTIQTVSDKVGDYHSFTEVDELLHQELALYINQAMAEELEQADREELNKILRETDSSHQQIGTEILTIISNF